MLTAAPYTAEAMILIAWDVEIMATPYELGYTEGVKGETAAASSCPYQDRRRTAWFDGFDDGCLAWCRKLHSPAAPIKPVLRVPAKRPAKGEYVQRRLAEIAAEHARDAS